MTELERYQQWCEQAPLNEAGRAALAAMQNDETERKGCFGAELQFGTAGIRGIMGIGTNRLNDFTVRRTAQGLAAWLTSTELPQRCAIGYDSRHNSRRYAELCAVALAERHQVLRPGRLPDDGRAGGPRVCRDRENPVFSPGGKEL